MRPDCTSSWPKKAMRLEPGASLLNVTTGMPAAIALSMTGLSASPFTLETARPSTFLVIASSTKATSSSTLIPMGPTKSTWIPSSFAAARAPVLMTCPNWLPVSW